MNELPLSLPSRFPERPLDDAQEKWWIAKVKPRQEKLLAQEFFDTGIEYYLPLSIRNTPRKGSTTPRLFHVPLFPGYISFSQESPHHIFNTGRVVTIIEIKHQKRFIQELNQIYFMIQGKAPLQPIKASFRKGTNVEIISGSFKGVKGIIEKSSRSTLIVSVEGLGCASLKVEHAWLKPIEEDE